MSKRIEITVDEDGEVTIEAFGYTGGSCVKATQPLSDALIGTPTHNVKKPEFYQPDNTQKQQEKH